MGVTANAVTVATCLVSVVLGLALYFLPLPRSVFLLMPLWMLIRMAFNAIDGMLAREFDQQSKLGAYLNELTDVLADSALLLAFVRIFPDSGFWIGLIVVLAALTEFSGALGPSIGASRRYDGPMGKSDRAAVLGLLGLWVGMTAATSNWITYVFPVMALLTAMTVWRRVQLGLTESNSKASK